ncbi:MAG: aminotransferase class IV [Flavobacteriaceae bacterium]|nr:aminotransferase class IV [Flavobacteriaceae bacterium]
MINFNGKLIAKNKVVLVYNNRAFTYGDALFETLKFQNNTILFLEDHYFRLMASMRMLRMAIPSYFTLEFLQDEIIKTIKINNLINEVRIKIQVFRKEGGFYLPKNNAINFLIEVSTLKNMIITTYEVDLFKDYYIFSGQLSTLKTTNRIINVLSSIYASENNLDNCILINEKKNIVEVNNGNLFIVKDNKIKTPALTEGCIKGVVRKKIIEMFQKNKTYVLNETEISPFELQKADALFITNSIIGIQEISKYRKKEYDLNIVKKIKDDFMAYYKF